MLVYQPTLSKVLLIIQTVIVPLVVLFYYPKVKNTYWKWLVFYLVFIAVQELYFTYNNSILTLPKTYYFAYIGIPIEFLFLFWLYAIKSLNNRVVFWIFSVLLMLTVLPIELYTELKTVNSITVTVGSLLLMILVFLEFQKQIKEDDILEFKHKRMFYINLGVLLFYVGSVPFMGLYNLLKNEHSIWNPYYLYFVVSNCLLYVSYILSFVCGKKN
jgi:hypothetical protein